MQTADFEAALRRQPTIAEVRAAYDAEVVGSPKQVAARQAYARVAGWPYGGDPTIEQIEAHVLGKPIPNRPLTIREARIAWEAAYKEWVEACLMASMSVNPNWSRADMLQEAEATARRVYANVAGWPLDEDFDPTIEQIEAHLLGKPIPRKKEG
jgi:hypothetical protein